LNKIMKREGFRGGGYGGFREKRREFRERKDEVRKMIGCRVKRA